MYFRKPKTRRGKRELIKREPKLIENPKTSIFLRANKAGEQGLKLAKDFVSSLWIRTKCILWR
jgi:hypothetical protein